MSHIPTRYFQSSFSMIERWYFINKYSDAKWEKAKTYTQTNKISKSAVQIAERVQNELGINLFPLITKIASKGWDISGGTYAFSMISDKGQTYYFDCRANQYKLKSVKLELHEESGSDVITLINKQQLWH